MFHSYQKPEPLALQEVVAQQDLPLLLSENQSLLQPQKVVSQIRSLSNQCQSVFQLLIVVHLIQLWLQLPINRLLQDLVQLETETDFLLQLKIHLLSKIHPLSSLYLPSNLLWRDLVLQMRIETEIIRDRDRKHPKDPIWIWDLWFLDRVRVQKDRYTSLLKKLWRELKRWKRSVTKEAGTFEVVLIDDALFLILALLFLTFLRWVRYLARKTAKLIVAYYFSHLFALKADWGFLCSFAPPSHHFSFQIPSSVFECIISLNCNSTCQQSSNLNTFLRWTKLAWALIPLTLPSQRRIGFCKRFDY